MSQRLALIVLVCFIVQQMMCEAKPSSKFFQTKTSSDKFDYEERLIKLQEELERTPAYGHMKRFIEKPECGGLPSVDMKDIGAGELILEALAMASRMVVEGCAQKAIDNMLILVSAFEEVEPIAVSNTSAGSIEADEAIRIILSAVPVLREVYTFMAASIYSGAGQNELSAALLPSVVQLTFSLYNKEREFENYEILNSTEEVLHKCAWQLEELSNEIHEEEVKDGSRRRRQEECERSWERSIYQSLKDVPFLGAVWEIGSAIGYAIAGCSGVAATRGRDGAANVAKVLTMYFASS